MQKPLAFRMRPTTIDQIIGQQHLVGQGKVIWRMVQAKLLSSMILYGPPGTGKTSIAAAISGSTSYAFRQLNAATDTKKELQAIVEEAKMSGTVILLLDEIHRLDKIKQDFLLPHLENGRIIVIGATTENPYVAISPAIRSRMQLFEVHPLLKEEIKKGLIQALTDKKNGLGSYFVNITPEALDYFSTSSSGDLRSALNALELAVLSTTPDFKTNQRKITIEIAKETLQQNILSYDKEGSSHYDTLSAFQKSIRGSDVDASLHYLARLILSKDLTSISRRLLVIVYEDIGLANPQACSRTVLAVHAANQLGFPEARIPLSHAVIDLCLSPKSNTSVTSIDSAIKDIKKGKSGPIPLHLKDNHFKDAQKTDYGKTYHYPHDFPDYWVDQPYLPQCLRQAHYYNPKESGKYEQALARRYYALESKKKKARKK